MDGRYVQFAFTAALAPGATTSARLLYRRTDQHRRYGADQRPSAEQRAWTATGSSAQPAGTSTYNCYPNNALYRHDLSTGQVTRIDLNSAGHPGNGHSFPLGISATGRVVFATRSSNIGEGGYTQHIYVR